MDYYFKALIEFDPIKCNEFNYDIDKCYKVIDEFYLNKGIDKLDQGVYVTDNKHFSEFMSLTWMAEKWDWFKNVAAKFYVWEGDIDNERYSEDVLNLWKRMPLD